MTYDNHSVFNDSRKDRPSAVRFFTNLPSPGLKLLKQDGYRYQPIFPVLYGSIQVIFIVAFVVCAADMLPGTTDTVMFATLVLPRLAPLSLSTLSIVIL